MTEDPKILSHSLADLSLSVAKSSINISVRSWSFRTEKTIVEYQQRKVPNTVMIVMRRVTVENRTKRTEPELNIHRRGTLNPPWF